MSHDETTQGEAAAAAHENRPVPQGEALAEGQAMKEADRQLLRDVRTMLDVAMANLEALELRLVAPNAPARCVDEEGRPLEDQLEAGSAHLTGAGAAPAPPTMADLFPNQQKLVAEWPDGSRVTFGPFADDRNARSFRPLAKAYLDPQAAAEAVWSLEAFCPGENLDVAAAELVALRG